MLSILAESLLIATRTDTFRTEDRRSAAASALSARPVRRTWLQRVVGA